MKVRGFIIAALLLASFSHPAAARTTGQVQTVAARTSQTASDLRPAPASKPAAVKGLAVQTFEIVDRCGEATHLFRATDAAICFHVTFRNLAPEQEHRHEARVVILDPDGKAYRDSLGGSLVVAPGDDLSVCNVLPTIDPRHSDGFRIANCPISQFPGTWKALLEVDDQVVAEQEFYVRPVALALR